MKGSVTKSAPISPEQRFRRYGPRVAACLLTATALLSGCAKLKIGLGLRTSLAKVPATSIEASLPNAPALAPGQKTGLVVTFQDTTGKIWTSEGAGKGRIEWHDITVQPTIVSINKKGTVSAPHDARLTDGKVGHLVVTTPSHPSLQAQVDIPFRYDYAFRARFQGAAGSSGTNGTSGTNGSDGTSGSTDPDSPSPGGNGTDGTNGTDGGDGGNGSPGPAVDVYATLRSGSHPLLQIGVLATGHRERFYLVDPHGGSLSVSSDGGAAGSGGKGGQGGRGGSGGSGFPPGISGRDGSNGRDGSDGSAGADGPVAVFYDPSVKPFLSAIQVLSTSPRPVFKEQKVDPLW